MNSEELEQSLRTEFENYLKNAISEMRQEVSQLQEKVEAEFDKHKSQLAEIFQNFSAQAEKDVEIDDIFTETVVEHMRLARDEGARITAAAIGEAEDLEKEAAPSAGISELRTAITEISAQTSQAEILKTLVNHAAQFTPRGAFFIVKNEHFVGWRTFGDEHQPDDSAIREIFFPLSSSTILGESVRSLSAVESSYGTYSDDSIYLNKLDFGQPSRMFAVPLVARGRGVAALYADYGTKGESINVEALETLVQIAGLTVELLAASQSARTAAKQPMPAAEGSKQSSAPTAFQATPDEKQFQSADNFQPELKPEETESAVEYQSGVEQPTENQTAETYQVSNDEPAGNDDSPQTENPVATGYQSSFENDSFSAQPGFPTEEVQNNFDSDRFSSEEITEIKAEPDYQIAAEQSSRNQPAETPPVENSYSWNQPAEVDAEEMPNYSDEVEIAEDFQDYQPASAENEYSAPVADNYQFEDSSFEETTPAQSDKQTNFEPAKTLEFESSQFESTENFAPAADGNSGSFQTQNGKTESSYDSGATFEQSSAPPAPGRSRFSERNVDLPIEVSEEERRLHNDARRFARLLVSEIKLYNEQKVKEGRDGSDLYERLREAIDRSREMYDKRVQPPVAAKFDYFHYELVNTLAEGEENRLGGSYPGATV